MKIIRAQLSAFKSSKRAKQSFNLLLTNFAGIPLGILTSVILAKLLGVSGFGSYSFIISIFTFSVLIATFGFFQAGNRALVLNKNEKRARQYYGAELVILSIVFFIMTIFLAIFGIIDENLKEKDLSNIFLIILPVGLVFLASNFIEVLLQADNKIGLLSTHRFVTKVTYLIGLVLTIYLFKFSISDKKDLLIKVFYIYIISQLLVSLFVLWSIKPTFSEMSCRLNELWQYNKSFGFNIYIGSVFAVGFTSLSQVLIGYFSETNDSVGFYVLALTFSAPLALIPNTIATVYYRDFSNLKKIPIKLLKVTLVISFIAFWGIVLLIDKFIIIFYGEDFLPVAKLNYIVSFGVLVHGFGDFYNRFLGANGQSIALRNSALIVGSVAIFIGLGLIPQFGEYGAAIARVLVAFVYLGIIFLYYLRYTKIP